MTESQIQKEIIEWLASQDYLAIRFPLGEGRADNRGYVKSLMGFPDLFGVFKNRKGQMFCIEVKSKSGKLSAHQEEWINRLMRRGVEVLVARSAKEVQTWMTYMDVSLLGNGK